MILATGILALSFLTVIFDLENFIKAGFGSLRRLGESLRSGR
jgi:hypothetical protein